MYICQAIWLIYLTRASSYILQDSRKVLLKDSAHYKIQESIEEVDFEMIHKDQLAPFNVEDKENKFYELKKLASEEYGKTSVSPMNWFKPVLTITIIINETTTIPPLTKHVHKRDTQIYDKPYDYENLVEEYYVQSIEEDKSNDTYHARKPGSSETGIVQVLKQAVTNDNTEDANNILLAIKCSLKNLKEQSESPKDLIARIWKNIKIWLYVYLVIAVALWCTKGWCFCCLPCKFFNPRRTIEEAKRYSMLNPPGVLIINRKITLYDATDAEKECFDKFEHILRTL